MVTGLTSLAGEIQYVTGIEAFLRALSNTDTNERTNVHSFMIVAGFSKQTYVTSHLRMSAKPGVWSLVADTCEGFGGLSFSLHSAHCFTKYSHLTDIRAFSVFPHYDRSGENSIGS